MEICGTSVSLLQIGWSYSVIIILIILLDSFRIEFVYRRLGLVLFLLWVYQVIYYE